MSRSGSSSPARAASAAALLVPALCAAAPLAVHAYSPLHLGLVLAVWVLALYALLVAAAEINLNVRSRVWDAMVLGHLLFVLGLVLVNASEFAVPQHVYEARLASVPVALTGLRLLLVPLMTLVALAFFRSWCTVFSLEPDLLSMSNARYLASAAIITLGSATLPFMWAPPLEAGSLLQPIVLSATVALAALVALSARIASRLLGRIPSFKNLRELMVYDALAVLFMFLYAAEAQMMPPEVRELFFTEILVFVALGFLCAILGMGVQVRALSMLDASFGMEGAEPRASGPPPATGAAMVGVLDDLGGRFIKTAELERLVERTRAEHPSLAGPRFIGADHRFDCSGLDLEDGQAAEALSSLFLGMTELLTSLSPPSIDRAYTQERLRRELHSRFGDSPQGLPPAVVGFVLPRELMLSQGIGDVFASLFPALPLQAGFGGILREGLVEAWGADAVSDGPGGVPSVDVRGVMERLRKEHGPSKACELLAERYGRTLSGVHGNLKNVMSREDIARLLESHVQPVAARAEHAAAGNADLFTNALFATSHTWGFGAVDKAAGRIPVHFSILLVHSPGFPKEHFYSTFIVENLRERRHAVWVSQARHAVIKQLLARVEDGSRALAQGRLRLLSIDPNVDSSKEVAQGCLLVGANLNTISWELRRAFESFPIGSICAVLELPPSALKEDTTMLYKFVSHVKSLCEGYDATLVVGVDSKICTGETLAMLRDVSELVVEAEREDSLRISRITGGPPTEVRLAEAPAPGP